jgi:hypothetical protein
MIECSGRKVTPERRVQVKTEALRPLGDELSCHNLPLVSVSLIGRHFSISELRIYFKIRCFKLVYRIS